MVREPRLDHVDGEAPRPCGDLTPAQHVARGRELIREVERDRAKGWGDPNDIAMWHADAMLANAHFTGAVAAEQLDLIELEKNPVRSIETPGAAIGPMPKHAHERAAQLAETYLPSYLGALLAGTLREPHSLPSLIEQKDRIATELIEWFDGEGFDIQDGSVDDVLAKLSAISITRGGNLPVWVESGRSLPQPVSGVRFSDADGKGGTAAVVISG